METCMQMWTPAEIPNCCRASCTLLGYANRTLGPKRIHQVNAVRVHLCTWDNGTMGDVSFQHLLYSIFPSPAMRVWKGWRILSWSCVGIIVYLSPWIESFLVWTGIMSLGRALQWMMKHAITTVNVVIHYSKKKILLREGHNHHNIRDNVNN